MHLTQVFHVELLARCKLHHVKSTLDTMCRQLLLYCVMFEVINNLVV